MKLSVPHWQQSQPYTCLPACIRMVLAYLGKEHNENELAQALQTNPILGTRPQDVAVGLAALHYRSLWFENATLERLIALLNESWPIIVFLRASDLPHGQAGLHAVVIGLEDDEIICLDPALAHESHFKLSSFLTIWSNLGNQGLVIWL